MAYAFDKERRIVFLCQRYIADRNVISSYFKRFEIKSIAVYGIGEVYTGFKQELLEGIDVKYYIDKYNPKKCMDGLRVVRPKEISEMEQVDAILITSVGFFEEIQKELQDVFHVNIPILDIETVINYDTQKWL
ncbi:MAG: hypothetical protein HFG82_05495 [Dorea sp.]|nr:hypothetical protein [Dorea sp.]